MKSPTHLKALAGSVALLFLALAPAAVAQNITLNSPGFDLSGGQISSDLDLNIFDGPPGSITTAFGSSGWYGMANSTSALNIGFRGGVEVNQPGTSAGIGLINYGLGSNLGGLLGLDIPDAYLWQPLAGVSFAANTTYTFSIDLNAGSLLDLTAFGDRGFGIGLTSGASTTSPGTFVADSLSDPSLLHISLLGGTSQRLTVSFTTDSNPPTGDIGVAVFAGRGTQALSASLLGDYAVDNATLAVPEPSSALLIASGLGVLTHWNRRRRPSTRASI